MSFRTVFSNRHVILPVVHVASEKQALRNVKIARDGNADGVFLINHLIESAKLLSIHRAVAKKHAGWWVGVNCLDLSPREVFQHVDGSVSGVWVDNAGINEREEPQPEAARVTDARKQAGWQGLYFGGVAFKYQRPVDDLTRAAKIAAAHMDVVTTSGPGTGHAASVKKIQSMKQALGDHPLAIASGITPDNVHEYLDTADCFLVATGISKSFEELDPGKLKALISNVRDWSTS